MRSFPMVMVCHLPTFVFKNLAVRTNCIIIIVFRKNYENSLQGGREPADFIYILALRYQH